MEILSGTLLTPSTLGSHDEILEAQDPSVIPYRDGCTNLPSQREHVTMNQLDLPGDGAHACWLTAAFKSALDAKPLTTTEDRAKAVKCWKDGWDYAVKNNIHVKGVGGTMRAGVEIALQFVNEAFPWNLKAYRFDLPRFDKDTSTQISFYRAINQGWMVTFGGYVNDDIIGDFLCDGVLDSDELPTGKGTYGHLRNLFCKNTHDFVADDNYPRKQGSLVDGLPYRNRYVIADLEKKVQSGQVFRSGYIFIPST